MPNYPTDSSFFDTYPNQNQDFNTINSPGIGPQPPPSPFLVPGVNTGISGTNLNVPAGTSSIDLARIAEENRLANEYWGQNYGRKPVNYTSAEGHRWALDNAGRVRSSAVTRFGEGLSGPELENALRGDREYRELDRVQNLQNAAIKRQFGSLENWETAGRPGYEFEGALWQGGGYARLPEDWQRPQFDDPAGEPQGYGRGIQGRFDGQGYMGRGFGGDGRNMGRYGGMRDDFFQQRGFGGQQGFGERRGFGGQPPFGEQPPFNAPPPIGQPPPPQITDQPVAGDTGVVQTTIQDPFPTQPTAAQPAKGGGQPYDFQGAYDAYSNQYGNTFPPGAGFNGQTGKGGDSQPDQQNVDQYARYSDRQNWG